MYHPRIWKSWIILRAAVEQLVIINPANFPPTRPGDCATNWRVMKGSCWRRDQLTGMKIETIHLEYYPSPYDYGYPELALPCTTTDCCLEYYEVCMLSDGSKQITQTGYLPPEDPDCDGQYYGDDGWYCQPVCGSIYNR